MRDRDKYYYIQVALPKNNAAIQRMVGESERLDTPLPILARQACINMYSEDVGLQPRVKPEAKQEPAPGVSVSEQSFSSADDFLDNL